MSEELVDEVNVNKVREAIFFVNDIELMYEEDAFVKRKPRSS